MLNINELLEQEIKYRHPEGLDFNETHREPHNPYFQKNDYQVAEETIYWTRENYIDFSKSWLEQNKLKFEINEDKKNRDLLLTFKYLGNEFEVKTQSYHEFGKINYLTLNINPVKDIKRYYDCRPFFLNEDNLIAKFVKPIYYINKDMTIEKVVIDETLKNDELLKDNNFYYINKLHHSSYKFIDYNKTVEIGKEIFKKLTEEEKEDLEVVWSNESTSVETMPGAVCGVDFGFDFKNNTIHKGHISSDYSQIGITEIHDCKSVLFAKFFILIDQEKFLKNEKTQYFKIGDVYLKVENTRFEQNEEDKIKYFVNDEKIDKSKVSDILVKNKNEKNELEFFKLGEKVFLKETKPVFNKRFETKTVTNGNHNIIDTINKKTYKTNGLNTKKTILDIVKTLNNERNKEEDIQNILSKKGFIETKTINKDKDLER